MKIKWISVKTKHPKCTRESTPVLIWPRNGGHDEPGVRIDGFCYYGTRATGRPDFYLFGAPIAGVEYWALLPDGPKATGR